MTGNRRYDLLMFDWDGTLSDSAAVITTALRAAGEALALPVLDEPRLRSIIGLSLEAAATELHDLSPARARDFAGEYRKVFLSATRPEAPLFAGARNTLEALRAEGYTMAVATGKGRVGLDRELRSSQLGALFDLSRCADETRSKPHPQMVEELLVDADCSPSRALVIGDTDFDLQMARAAGVDAVAVTCGNHEHARLAACEPAAILDSVASLPTWLVAATR